MLVTARICRMSWWKMSLSAYKRGLSKWMKQMEKQQTGGVVGVGVGAEGAVKGSDLKRSLRIKINTTK